MADTLRNLPEGFDGLKEEAADYKERCERVVSEPLTEETAPLAQALNGEGIKLKNRVEDARREEKIPHERAAKEVDARFKPVTDITLNAQALVKRALEKHLKDEAAKKEAIRLAAAEQERLAREALAAAADPFKALQAKQELEQAAEIAEKAREKVTIANADGGRSIGLKTYWSAAVTDPRAMVIHYADRPSVIAAARALADAEMKSSKGEANIPGCVPFKEQRA